MKYIAPAPPSWWIRKFCPHQLRKTKPGIVKGRKNCKILSLCRKFWPNEQVSYSAKGGGPSQGWSGGAGIPVRVIKAMMIMEMMIIVMMITVKVLQCTMCILGSMFTFQPNKLRHILTLLAPGGGTLCPPLLRICVFLCKYAYELVEKTWLFSVMSLEKGSTLFTP